MTVRAIVTRFRAYQLGTSGGSFSYCSGKKFTLVEARLTDVSEQNLRQEMDICGADRISTVHITSWDQDHCSPNQLERILEEFIPRKIEYPGYIPHSDSGKESLSIINRYKRTLNKGASLVSVTPTYIKSLDDAERYGYNDIFYHPKYWDDECPNNNSSVKQFRSGSFNVLSLGDVESPNLSAGLRRQRTISGEADVMIMAHHGADNGFTTSSFLRTVKPTVAIATSNFGNQFDHPKPKIRELLFKYGVDLFTTKTGDVVIMSIKGHTGMYEVINLIAGSSKVSKRASFVSKKKQFLIQNIDSIRNRITRHNRGPR